MICERVKPHVDKLVVDRVVADAEQGRSRSDPPTRRVELLRFAGSSSRRELVRSGTDQAELVGIAGAREARRGKVGPGRCGDALRRVLAKGGGRCRRGMLMAVTEEVTSRLVGEVGHGRRGA